MNLRLLGYIRSYQVIRALIVYRYLYEIYKNYQETLYQVESSFSDLAAWDTENNQEIDTGGETHKQKTASGVNAKKARKTLVAEQPEKQNSIRSKPYLTEKLRSVSLLDSMNLYQSFNMNPVNFVDPMGEIILLSDDYDKARSDFMLILEIFKRIGIENIEEYLDWEFINGKNQIYLKKGKGSLALAGKKYGVTSSAAYQKWVKDYTKELKKFPMLYNMELEELFEWMILDTRHVAVDFETNEYAYQKDFFLWFDRNAPVWRYGGGVTLEPFETMNEHSKVVVDPKRYSAHVGPNLPLDVPTIIVHEFGHALGNMLGYYGTLLATKLDVLGITKSEDPLFYELAVMFENLYRLRLKQKYLRGFHSKYNSHMKVEEEQK